MRVVPGRAIGEFHHLQRTEPNRAGVLQALQRRRGRGRDEILADFRAAGDDLAVVVIHVLVRQRHAVQHALDVAFRQRRVGGVGRFQASSASIAMKALSFGCQLRDPVEAGLRRLARGDASSPQSPSRPRSATSRRARCSSSTPSPLHQPESRRLQVERQRAGDRREALEGRTDRIGDARGVILGRRARPSTSAIALISFAVGFVMLRPLPLFYA